MHTDLKTARERRGWTQKALALKAGVDTSIISRIESGATTNPSYSTVCKLESALRLRRGTLEFGHQDEALAS
jgi:transcriptional regulator with XRE-family HTH domain